MHIVMTHEQADFDALASLLGASLIDEQAIPVLPRRVNRNVRAFLNLYNAKLPFVEAQDLPSGNISTITLVDTQSLVTLKGLTQKTNIVVIDHHQERENLPEDWMIKIDRVGACTTLFVEHFREQYHQLSPIYATLLLLGIYEDTGSLSYVGTTPRDIWASAYLLEQGAALQIISDYLNPPLSPGQRELYDRLLNASKYHTIHGQKIVIACGDGRQMDDEISSVAHKIRDLLDLDALFLLVKTSEGIRMVARSTSDKVNVADIAAHFGGGGHERASAALIRSESDSSGQNTELIQHVCQELTRVLPRYVHPAIVVEQIMSRQPMLLSPATSVREAESLMQRYGYEGYPVVDNGRVVGLLTRRAVDRAISHKLELTASSLMEAGEVSVRPHDALEDLQRVMSTSGWGQIPVVDEKTSEVIGIVTRTDLLATMNGMNKHHHGYQNLETRLKAALPSTHLALLQNVASEAYKQKAGIYIVGGFVRDLLLGSPSPDFDIVVEGDAIALGKALVEQFGGRVITHRRFGTAKWIIEDIRDDMCHRLVPASNNIESSKLPKSLDLVSARTEFYEYPTALPTVKKSSIKLDLHRRDFSINTMAIRLDGHYYGELFDYWGGLNDLNQKLVRVLHSLSFVDDPTRLLRAVRFEQRFGFSIETRTLHLMEEARLLMRQVSGDRLRHELNMILDERNVIPILRRLQQLGLLSGIHAKLYWSDDIAQSLSSVLAEPIQPEWNLPDSYANIPIRRLLGYLVWLSSLPQTTAMEVVHRLRLAAYVKQSLKMVYNLKKEFPAMLDMSPSRIVKYLETIPDVSLYAFYQLDLAAFIKRRIESYIKEWRYIKPFTDGKKLFSLGLKPGPMYKNVLETLRAAWLDDEIKTADDEAELLKKLVEHAG